MSTPNLKLHWKAILKDHTISQFDTDGEHKFQEVLDNLPNLVAFELQHTEQPLLIHVDLERGLIFINGFTTPEPELIDQKINIRPIYFRRNKISLDCNHTILNHEVIYFIGYQYLGLQGDNHKIVLQVTQNGQVVLGV